MKRTIAALMTIACFGCSSLGRSAAEAVDIPTLLASPSAYEGKLVTIRGAAVSRFEAQYICPDVAQIDSDRSKECLWLAPAFAGEGLGPGEISQYHGKWVVLTGKFNLTRTFNKGFLGHGGIYGGTITPISARVVGTHGKGNLPPPPPEPSANNSFKPKPLRGSA